MNSRLMLLVIVFVLAAVTSCTKSPVATVPQTSSIPTNITSPTTISDTTPIQIPASGVKLAGDLRVWIVTVPSPPTSGNNTLEAFIIDVNGQPVSDAVLTFNFNMTNMNMGQSIYHPLMMSEGRYSSTVRFSMPGPWRVIITIVRGGQTSSVQFDFSVR